MEPPSDLRVGTLVLLSRARSGMGDARNKFISQIQDRVMLEVRRRLRVTTPRVAETLEVAQDIFCTLDRRLTPPDELHFATDKDLEKYLTAAISLRVAHYRRSRSVERGRSEPIDGIAEQLASTGEPGPVDRVLAKESESILLEQIDGLDDDRERQAILLRADGLTFEEIGPRIGVTPNHASRLFAQAFRRLAEQRDHGSD